MGKRTFGQGEDELTLAHGGSFAPPTSSAILAGDGLLWVKLNDGAWWRVHHPEKRNLHAVGTFIMNQQLDGKTLREVYEIVTRCCGNPQCSNMQQKMEGV